MAATAAVVSAVAAVAGTGVAVYGATKPGQTYKARPPAPPGHPDTSSLTMSQQAADQQARSAGGTLLADEKQKPVGDAANAVRKSLLGQ